MATNQKSDKKDRHRKSGQNLRYKAEHRREKNKVRKLRKHLKREPNDHCALNAARVTSAALGRTFEV